MDPVRDETPSTSARVPRGTLADHHPDAAPASSEARPAESSAMADADSLRPMPSIESSEAVKRIARLVLARKMSNESLRVLFTAPQRHSNNNSAALNLARHLSDRGEPVVLIDASTKAPRIAPQARVDYGPGFTELLTGENTFMDVLQRDPRSRLHIIAGGAQNIDVTAIMGSDRMEQVLDALEGTYSFIIIDAPPTMLGGDAVTLASKCDLAVVVPDTLPGGHRMTIRTRDVLSDHGRQPVEVLIADASIADLVSGEGAGNLGAAM